MSQKILTFILTITLVIFVFLIFAIHKRFQELSLNFAQEKSHWQSSFETIETHLKNFNASLDRIETTSQDLTGKIDSSYQDITVLKIRQEMLDKRMQSYQNATKDFILSLSVLEEKIHDLQDNVDTLNVDMTSTKDILSKDIKNTVSSTP